VRLVVLVTVETLRHTKMLQ